MNIKYHHVKLSKISLALIYSSLDIVNSPNSNTSCTNQSNLFCRVLKDKAGSNVKVLGGNFFSLTIYFFSLYANRFQVLHKYCFQFLLHLPSLQ